MCVHNIICMLACVHVQNESHIDNALLLCSVVGVSRQHMHMHTHGRRPHMLLCDTLSLQVSSRGRPCGAGPEETIG